MIGHTPDTIHPRKRLLLLVTPSTYRAAVVGATLPVWRVSSYCVHVPVRPETVAEA